MFGRTVRRKRRRRRYGHREPPSHTETPKPVGLCLCLCLDLCLCGIARWGRAGGGVDGEERLDEASTAGNDDFSSLARCSQACKNNLQRRR